MALPEIGGSDKQNSISCPSKWHESTTSLCTAFRTNDWASQNELLDAQTYALISILHICCYHHRHTSAGDLEKIETIETRQ
jgi:hypothetical protein